MKSFLSTLLLFFVLIVTAQQRPFINSIDKISATVGETITISGSGFDANSANLKVFFGAGMGTITSSTSSQIKVTVPANATYAPITVVNTNTNLGGSSSELFSISYDGGSFLSSGFDALDEISTGSNFSYELCLCDFDLDGLSDVGVTHRSSQEVRLFQNQSTVNTTSFAEMGSITIADNNFRSTGIDCGDLDMDGLPDLVFASNIGNNPVQIYFYENVGGGGISFTQRQSLTLPLNGTEVRTPRKLKLADIDGDGLKDLVIGSESDNSFFIYLNNYSGGNLSFNSTPVRIAVSGLADAGTIDIKDMNNDNLPDLAIIAFDEANQPLAFLKNTSSPGSVSFTSTVINSLEQRNYTFIGDLNDDSYPEIITSNSFSNRISIFQNTTNVRGSNITFNSSPTILTNIQSTWGISMGDMNGDGLPDLVVSSGPQGVRVIINTSSGGTISFATPTLLASSGTEIVRNLKTGDLNGDAKPDVIFTYNSTSGAPGKLGAFINRNCYEPVISPPDLTFCLNDPFTLFATKSAESSYNWSISSGTGTITPNGDNADVTITAGTTASISVQITPNNNGNGTCTNATTQVFTITNGTPTATPTISASAPNDVCTGETNFTLSTSAGLDNYYWTLPDGSTGPNQNTLTIPTLTAANAGVYSLRTQTGLGCVSDEATYEVIVNEPPFININNQNQDNFCDGSTITLEVPDYPGFTYTWERNGSTVAGTNNTLDVTTSGTYHAIITDGTCENVSPDYVVTAVPSPVSSFNTSFNASNITEICLDVPLDFTATSTGTGSFALTYDWDFGDATSGSGSSTSHTYTTAGTFDVTLTTSYTDIAGCSDQIFQTITVTDQAPGDIPITVVGGSTEKCPSETLTVQLPANYISYDWSSSEDPAFTDTDFEAEAVTPRGVNQVTLTADVETNIGCMVTVQQTIDNFPNSGIGVVPSQSDIINDTLQMPEGVQNITLSATNAVGDYIWTVDGTQLDIVTSALEVRPTQRTTIVEVTGTDANGCMETTTTTVLLPAILARKTFSPNADGLGFDCWEILNTSSLEGCTVYIFDNRGRHIVVEDSPFIDNCVWDGMTQGQQAPEGIYYFVLKCDDEQNNLNGTITLAR